jgi:predicted HTH transcriptional regulator
MKELNPFEYGLEEIPTPHTRALRRLKLAGFTPEAKRSEISRRASLARGERTLNNVYSLVAAEPKLTNAQIGERLGIAKSTVARHLKTLIGCGMLQSQVRYIPGFTKHPLAFRELTIPNAIPESKKRLEENAEPRSRASESDPWHPQNVQ